MSNREVRTKKMKMMKKNKPSCTFCKLTNHNVTNCEIRKTFSSTCIENILSSDDCFRNNYDNLMNALETYGDLYPMIYDDTAQESIDRRCGVRNMIIQKAFSQIKRTSKIENIPVESMYFKISVINDSGAEERDESIVVSGSCLKFHLRIASERSMKTYVYVRCCTFSTSLNKEHHLKMNDGISLSCGLKIQDEQITLHQVTPLSHDVGNEIVTTELFDL